MGIRQIPNTAQSRTLTGVPPSLNPRLSRSVRRARPLPTCCGPWSTHHQRTDLSCCCSCAYTHPDLAQLLHPLHVFPGRCGEHAHSQRVSVSGALGTREQARAACGVAWRGGRGRGRRRPANAAYSRICRTQDKVGGMGFGRQVLRPRVKVLHWFLGRVDCWGKGGWGLAYTTHVVICFEHQAKQ